MSRSVKVEAGSLEGAFRRLLAELAGADEEVVELRFDVPGLDTDELGEVRLGLEVVGQSGTAVVTTEQPVASDEIPEVADDDVVEVDVGNGEVQGRAPSFEVEDEDEDEIDAPEVSADELDEEADAAADFLEGLLDAMDLPGDIQIRVHEDHAEVEIVNIGTGRLIGRRGQTLDAIQELMRCALQRQFQRRARVMVDIEGYRTRRLERLLEKAQEAIDDVLSDGEPQRLEPMDAFERKAVHRLVAAHEGVISGSRGREPTRRVVIERA